MYSCAEHIEFVLDIFLDEIEEMPVMEEISEAGVACAECERMAQYRLSGSEVKVRWE